MKNKQQFNIPVHSGNTGNCANSKLKFKEDKRRTLCYFLQKYTLQGIELTESILFLPDLSHEIYKIIFKANSPKRVFCKTVFFFNLCICVSVWVCVHIGAGACRSQKRNYRVVESWKPNSSTLQNSTCSKPLNYLPAPQFLRVNAVF